MSTLPVPSEPERVNPADELGSLARELARGYAELVESHRRSWGIGVAEAEGKAREGAEWWAQQIANDPPDRVSWSALSLAMEHAPEAALAAWERVKEAARKELRSGHRSAQSLEWGGHPIDRARFLAIREAFALDWRPRGGVESALVDLLAQTFDAYLRWTARLSMYAETQCELENVRLEMRGYRPTPRLDEARWLDWCAGQAEAAHRRFLTTLRAMQDVRRLPAVTIAGAAQVNIGHQQLNVAARDGASPRDLPK